VKKLFCKKISRSKKVKNLISNPNKEGYTIIELLTVMTIVIILIGLLVPSVSMVKRFAKKVRQKVQFHGIEVAMELYNNEFEGYPDSDEKDKANPQQQYCGAMKLAEAMVGQDLMGFHPSSQFRADCLDGGTTPIRLYDNPPGTPPSMTTDNLKSRRGPYLQLDNANPYRMRNIYGIESGDTDPFLPYLFVLCDVYTNVGNRRDPAFEKVGKAKIGMPILYYKANPAGTKHPYFDVRGVWQGNVEDPENIYDYKDNHKLVEVELGMPFNPGVKHRLEEDLTQSPPEPKGYRFYIITRNNKILTKTGMPCHPDSYILISAGFDGEYGTGDDIFNFEP
jgi:type II secretory pathway pseudopilin PulG